MKLRLKTPKTILVLKKSRFFKLVSEYKNDPENFDIKHKGNDGNRKISTESDDLILKELKEDKKLIDNKNIPVRLYNYSAYSR